MRAGPLPRTPREAVILSHIGLALSRARMYYRFARTRQDMEDLDQAAFAGLTIAVDRYDPSRNVRFSTYAVYWIDRVLRSTARGLLSPIRAADGAPPVRVGSLDDPASQDSDVPLRDTIPDPASLDSDPSDAVARDQALSILSSLVDTLPPREREVVSAYHGLEGDPLPFDGIAARMGISKERVRQLYGSAIRRLQLWGRASGLGRLAEDAGLI
jgi:RNA polymerase sigma factor (sigma-70 family)